MLEKMEAQRGLTAATLLNFLHCDIQTALCLRRKNPQAKGDLFCCDQTGRGKSEDFCSDTENFSLVNALETTQMDLF